MQGQSGSPVLRQKDLVSIGAHVYGGSKQNSASPIMTKWGNPYKDYIAVFDHALSSGKSIQYVPLVHTEDAMDAESESFWDTLKHVVQVAAPIASNVLQVATPFMGPVGAPLAAVAGTALGLASKLTESSMAESSMGDSISTHGIAERALLGEAALQTVLNMDHDVAQKSGVFDTMVSVYTKLGPVVTKLAPKLMPAVVEPALRLALDHIQKSNPIPATESSMDPRASFWTPPPASFNTIKVDAATKAFGDALAAAPAPKVEGAEGFFDSLGSIIQTGLKIVPIVAPTLGSLLGVTESEMEPTPTEAAMTRMFHRAAMGEAALQALIKYHSDKHEEGFFGDFLDTVQKIGSQVIKVAPDVIQTAAPIALQLLKASSSSRGGTESGFGGATIQGPNKGPKHQKSVADWLRDGATGRASPNEPTGSKGDLPSADANKPKVRSKMGVRFLTESQKGLPTVSQMGFPQPPSRTVSEEAVDTTSGSDSKEDTSQSLPPPGTETVSDRSSGGDASQSLPPTGTSTVPDKSAPPDVPQEPQQDGVWLC